MGGVVCPNKEVVMVLLIGWLVSSVVLAGILHLCKIGKYDP